ncbi:MAG TPA: hypothetical protein VIC87_07875, partial [Vicinamibacteria bacterium]
TAVAPTVLDYLGIEPLAGMDARSLLGLLRGQEDDTSEEGFAFSEDVWIGPAAHAVRSRDWKLIERGEELPERFLDSDARRAIHRRVSVLAKEMLFDLGSDPRERTNRMTEDAVTADRLRGLLRRRFGSAARAKSEGDIPVEGEALERLRSLGYVQ